MIGPDKTFVAFRTLALELERIPTQEEAAAAIHCHRATITEHLKLWIHSGLIVKTGKHMDTAVITPYGMTFEPRECGRNEPVELQQPRKRCHFVKEQKWVNPLARLPYPERLSRIVERAYHNGTLLNDYERTRIEQARQAA